MLSKEWAIKYFVSPLFKAVEKPTQNCSGLSSSLVFVCSRFSKLQQVKEEQTQTSMNLFISRRFIFSITTNASQTLANRPFVLRLCAKIKAVAVG
jgi:hypothetical protein